MPTVWKVEREAVREGGRWRVVETREGRPVGEARTHLSGLPCIAARVLASELNRAWQLGRREVFAEGLGDD